MLTSLLGTLRAEGLRVGLSEWLVLMEGLSKGLGTLDVERFHAFARLCLVKDETLYDRFDRAFGAWWEGREASGAGLLDELAGQLGRELPADWLRPDGAPPDPATLDPETRAALEAAGGWERLMRTLAERLDEQRGRHAGGNRWIGTGGTSPFGQNAKPGAAAAAGVRIGEGAARRGRGVKSWERRAFRELDGDVALGTRNLSVALGRLRRLAREGRPDTLDLDGTVRATAEGAGLLDVRLRAERRDAMEVLLLIDVGGSMDAHARTVERLFSAARSRFRRLETFYFHNAVYERVWHHAARRREDEVSIERLLRTYGRRHRLFVVGDAAMSPWELVHPGGSVEHWNEESGATWLRRTLEGYPHAVWLNPEPVERWERTPSIRLVRELMGGRMHPLTPDGVAAAIRALKKPAPTADGAALADPD